MVGMIQLRWKVEEWEEWRDGMNKPIKHQEKPVLQYRQRVSMKNNELWSDWQDVPSEYVEI